MWPGGDFGSRGKIPAGELASLGRALIHADAPEWRELVRDVFGRVDAPPPDELVDAIVRILGVWRDDWSRRPDVVLGLPAGGFPTLTEGLVDRIADVGRLDKATLQVADGFDIAGAAELASSGEAAAWRDALSCPDPAAIEGRVVLLVVDATRSLWPITLAAALLRRSGADAVLPLVVHRLP
jgi:ATP-dependent DNA helicase RecQ